MDATKVASERAGRARTLLVVAIAAALVLTTVVASRPDAGPMTRTSTVEENGLEWGEVTIVRADGADGGTVEASVLMDGEPFPTADGRDDRFVMFQLDGGRFDTDRHSDDSRAERVIGLDDDDRIQISFARTGVSAAAIPSAGEYTMSLDGTIRYEDVDAGTMELRAYVVDRSGTWDGEVALREVRVR